LPKPLGASSRSVERPDWVNPRKSRNEHIVSARAPMMELDNQRGPPRGSDPHAVLLYVVINSSRMILAPASFRLRRWGASFLRRVRRAAWGWRETREGESKTKGKMKKTFIAIAAAGSAR
jgi:hypothetical protein